MRQGVGGSILRVLNEKELSWLHTPPDASYKLARRPGRRLEAAAAFYLNTKGLQKEFNGRATLSHSTQHNRFDTGPPQFPMPRI